MENLNIFINRLKKIGITVELIGNYPWIYLDKVNSIKVEGKFEGNHGFNSPEEATEAALLYTLKHLI